MAPQLAIQMQGLCKSFGDVQALKALDLAVPQHSIFGFLGPNGAGKTTTMKLLLGLARPTRGSRTILGHDIVHDSLAIRTRIGYLPQHPRFIDSMTARATLRFTARFFFSGPAAGIEQRIDEMLRLVGLTEKADRPVKGFSGGERQRLGLAQAQINNPDLLILDEPTATLGTLFGGLVIPGFLGRLAMNTPWVLPNLLPAYGAGATLPASVWQPLGMTAVFVVVFTATALYLFKRLEF